MKFCLVFIIVLVLMLFSLFGVQVYQEKVGDFVIDYFWVWVSLGNVLNGVVYMEVINNGILDDWFVGVIFSNVDCVEFYIYEMEGEVMCMWKVEEGVDIFVGEMVFFELGGFYVMMFGLKDKLVVGEVIFMML